MSSVVEKVKFNSVKLPIKGPIENSRETLNSLKSLVQKYRETVRGLLESLDKFFDFINNQYAQDTLGSLREAKFYQSCSDLFNFNHFDVQFEISEFIKKEEDIAKQFEGMLSNNPRNDSFTSKTILQPQMQGELPEVFKLRNALDKIKRSRNKHRQANKETYQKYLDTLRRMEEEQNNMQNVQIDCSIDNGHNENRRTFSADAKNSSDHKSFEIFPNGNNVSLNAFNPDIPESPQASLLSAITSGPPQMRSIISSKFSLSPEKVKHNARKRDMEQQKNEIDMLKKEINVLKRELADERNEKSISIANIERSVKYEKAHNQNVIHDLQHRLDIQREASKSNRNVDNHETRKLKKELDDLKASQLESSSIMSSKIDQKNKTVRMLKTSLGNMLSEKRDLQTALHDKKREINNLQDKINGLETASNTMQTEFNNLELTNSHLTTKFLMSVERESEMMKKYNQMKMKLRAYERLVEKMNAS